MKTKSKIDPDRVLEVISDDELIGFCLACGAEKDSCEPDARKYECDECGAFEVYGAEELLMMGEVS
jgi:hypothetical protein